MWMWGSAIPFPTTIGFSPVAGATARSSMSARRQLASGHAPQRSPPWRLMAVVQVGRNRQPLDGGGTRNNTLRLSG
eukprot:scaffold39753_cov65-Phaeocystis_antarctica.AAC.14